MKYEYEYCNKLVHEMVEFINSVLDQEDNDLINYDYSESDCIKVNLSSYKNPRCSNMFTTGSFFNEYLREENGNPEYDVHYFAFNPDDEQIVMNLNYKKDGRNRYMIDNTVLDFSSEEGWFQGSTLYTDIELFVIMIYNAFKQENFPACLIELTEIFKYMEKKNVNL